MGAVDFAAVPGACEAWFRCLGFRALELEEEEGLVFRGLTISPRCYGNYDWATKNYAGAQGLGASGTGDDLW